MNRAALLSVLEPVAQMEEIVVPKSGGSSSFSVKDDGLYWDSGIGQEYKVGKNAAPQALRHVPGLSAAAIKEWPVDMLIEPLNWWYKHGEGDVRVLANSEHEIMSFTKRADHGINNPVRMLEAIEEGLEEKGVKAEDLYYDKVRVGLDKVSFAVVTHERHGEFKTGDIVDAGIIAFTSPTGESHIEVSPYLNRLWCTNGMVSPVAMGRWSVRGGDGGSVFDWAKEMTLQSWDAIDDEMEAVRNLTTVEVDGNVHNVLADLFERHHIPVAQRQLITEQAVENFDGTMFGISQAFNQVANDLEDVEAMKHLMMVTGDVAHQTERCSSCLRAIS